MQRAEIVSFIEKNKNRHLPNKVLHAHPSPTLWTTDYSREEILKRLTYRAPSTRVNLYMGIPFCLPTDPPHCGFCLFPTAKYCGRKSTSTYLNYLELEAALYADHYATAQLESLYVGGGTPNLLDESDYARLTAITEQLFSNLGPGIERTIEGIPQLFTEKKVSSIAAAGFNRVSMGVQQVNDQLIRYSGRKQTSKQVFDSLSWFNEYGLASSVDLIYGWPEQTPQDMLRDLQVMVEFGVRHITHYELNIAGRSAFATRLKDLVPDIDNKLAMYHLARDYLIDAGYQQRTVYDWEFVGDTSATRSQYCYEDNLRRFSRDTSTCMGGLGSAAINIRMHATGEHNNSMSTMNHRDLNAYFADIEQGRMPIERAFFHEPMDTRLVWLFQSLQEMQVDGDNYQDLFGTSINEFENIWQYLEEIGWLKRDGNYMQLVGSGSFFTPMIQALLSKSRIDELTRQQRTVRDQ